MIEGLLFSPEDADLYDRPWRKNADGYAIGRHKERGKQNHYRAHRVVLARILGRGITPIDITDHINGCRLDNRRENLRLTTRSGNQRNRHAIVSGTGYIGVIFHRPEYSRIKLRYEARLQARVDGKKVFLYRERFPTARQAAEAYNAAAERLGFSTRNKFTD
jgi:hypothetical protein